MNKREALEKTLEIWKELAANPDYDKSCPPMRHLTDHLVHGCPCCQYVTDLMDYATFEYTEVLTTEICEPRCPLWRLWGDQHCEDLISPYAAWQRGDDCLNDFDSKGKEMKTEAAEEIVEGIKLALEELNNDRI